jgi:hypothetical protein
MKAAPVFWTSLLVALSLWSIAATAAPAVDGGTGPASKEKAERHAQMYKDLPSEAFGACLGRPAGVKCSYVLPPTNSRPYSVPVDGSCWAPENSVRLPLGCR